MHLLHFEVWLYLCGSEYNQTSIIMNRQEFEELELQVKPLSQSTINKKGCTRWHPKIFRVL
jgi:hypothetical protein